MSERNLFTLGFLFLQSVAFANALDGYRNELYQEIVSECND
ncbi:hypothetical protein [Helicobacter sp. UBA3407]|nr:hypothetical protein [Helicobacter sp. UBA3407]